MEKSYHSLINTAGIYVALLLFPTLVFSQVALPGANRAGYASQDPGYTYGASANDITAGTRYYYLKNDSIIANISTVKVANNTRGSLAKGSIMDVIQKRRNRDNLDWGQFLIHTSILPDWSYPTKNVNLDSIWITGIDSSSISSYGATTDLPNIKVRANYSLLNNNSPIVKIKLRLFNTGTVHFNGFIEYELDPDETNQQRAYIPGLGDSPGPIITSGWTSNYIYAGIQDAPFVMNTYPNHGIAWVRSTPVALNGQTFIFGAWFQLNIPAGDSTDIEFYHITDVADNSSYTQPQQCISKWAENLLTLDTELSNYKRVHGHVEDVHAIPVANMLVKAKNTSAQVKGQAMTDSAGNYSFILPDDVYTFTVAGLGYLLQSRSIAISSPADTVLDFTVASGFPLIPIQVYAGTGKQINSPGLVITGEEDIIMENDKIAVAIGVKTVNSQQPNASKGAPLDFIVKSNPNDLIDWISLVKMSPNNDTADLWWSRQSAMMDTVYVVNNTANEANVRATGRIYRVFNAAVPLGSNEVLEIRNGQTLAFRTDIAITSDYKIKYGDNFFYVKTVISNNSGTDSLKMYLGDIMDFDGTGEVSFVPGVGEVNGDFGLSANYEFAPNAPWFAQYGAANLAYGMVYEGSMADSFKTFGVKRFMSSKKYLQLAPNTVFSLDRYIIAASTIGFPAKSDAIAAEYNKIKVQQTGIIYNITNSNSFINKLDTVTASINIKNTNLTSVFPIRVSIKGGYNVEVIGLDSQIVSINGQDSAILHFKLVGKTGGRAFSIVKLTDHQGNVFEKKISVFVNAEGWFAGDNHSHSIFSDGVGTIAENVESGYSKGLAFMTATDHNTINHQDAVNVEDARYPDMIIMTGEEVTTSRGHSLAYNTGRLIPWQLATYTEQQIIDSTNNSGTAFGRGFMYLAHPHYPGLPWVNLDVRRETGLEVWNGFYAPTHPVNSLTFNDWDSLNKLGRHFLGISNSDAHNPAVVGNNYIMAYLDSFTKGEIISVMRDRGNYFGTNGPLLNFTIDTVMMGGNIIAPAVGKMITINIEGNSNREAKIDVIRLLKNGVITNTWNPDSSKASYTLTTTGLPGDYYRIELQSGSGYAYSNPVWIMPQSTLPFTLFSFTGKRKGTKVDLVWTTLSEINNNRFELERSSDGVNFSTIAKTKGAGNSNRKSDYNYLDQTPFNGDNYYRLKQVDFDGRFNYSSVILVNINRSELAPLQVFPNPSEGIFTLTIPQNQISEIAIYNTIGKKVWAGRVNGSSTYTINLSKQAKGLYVIKVVAANGTQQLQTVIIK